MTLSELTVLCTNLSNKVTSLEAELAQTKQTYGTALTKLIKKVKKLEQTVKSTQARRRFRIVVSDDEEGLEDPSKQGRKITKIDQDPSISLVQDEGTSWIQEDIEIQEKISDDTEVVLEEEEPTELVEDQGSGEKGEKEVSTVGAEHSTVIPEVSTAAANLVYIRRSAQKRKDKGKAIMEEDESVQKKTKKQLEQERLGHEEAIRLQEQIDEEERQRIARDAEIAKQLQEEINKATQEQEKQEVVTKADPTHVIDWSDPAGGYKMIYFKEMSYEDIRPIFEKKRDDSSKPAEGRRIKTLAKKRASGKDSEESMKKQKLEDDTEKEDLKAYLDLVLKEEFAMKIESLGTKYLIVDWKTHVLTENFMYYQIIRADGGSKNYKIFSEMLDDFGRLDVSDLHKLVKARYMTSSPEEVNGHGIAIHMMIVEEVSTTQEMLSPMFSIKPESSSVQSIFDVPVTAIAEPPLLSVTTTPPPPTPLITHLLKTLENNFSEFNQTNQFAALVSSILGIVDAYLANKMHEAVKTAVQLQSERLIDEAQAENTDFINKLDDNIKKIIKNLVKEQVKAQVSKIFPKIEKTVNEQLEAEILTRSSNESKTSHAVAVNLFKLELKKILINKMESNKSIYKSNEQKNLYKALVDVYESGKLILDTYGDTVSFKRCRDDEDKDEEPSAGLNRGSKRRRAGKQPESTSAPKEKTSKTTGKSTKGSKSHRKSAGESTQTEEPMHTAKDLEEPTHQEFKTRVTEDQHNEETS
ncbi:hypothetical protein Tco_1287619 [Tanacetum coccineum]